MQSLRSLLLRMLALHRDGAFTVLAIVAGQQSSNIVERWNSHGEVLSVAMMGQEQMHCLWRLW
jgi:hypothetical protein